ncbi:unnamed protein product [Hermetia illucens]|uniref:Pyroglutamyl-peptidase 1 n=1 Tax=Hermetia illucens TaxID=343691 RepID=A0A7R8UDS7_HERIL|nr:pyroglutamyl-peptidase 1 [Hermetia illucens]CAD7078917.1 unnamed protein product [Hermetia illucens]
MDENLVIVTGFGPFVGHELVNASWEAVRLLPDSLEHDGKTHNIEKVLIPVQYDAVDEKVDEIWKRNPKLVIHCGVNGNANCIHLEQLAYNNQFCRPDFSGKILNSPSVCLDNAGSCCDTISTEIDVQSIVDKLFPDTEACNPLCICSRDVGNYLCGYIYLKSLDRDKKRCLFVHVPPIDQPFSSQTTSEAIRQIIEECLHQLKKTD